MEELEELYRKYREDKNPILVNLRESATKFVRGVGPLHPDIMLIGEAPGKQEDKVGEPFVGPAGEVLDLLCLRAKVKRDSIFITNTVKYRPIDDLGKDRKPTEAESAYNKPYVQKEIEIVKPKVLGLMGKPAIQMFFPLHSPRESHGHTYTQSNPPVVFLYHPAVASYNPKQINTLIADFKVLLTLV